MKAIAKLKSTKENGKRILAELSANHISIFDATQSSWNIQFLKLDFSSKEQNPPFLITSDISTCQQMLFPSFIVRSRTVLKLISWEHPFERLNEEYEMTRRKKEALDNLLNAGKISQSTYDLFTQKIDEAIAEIERQQKALLEKMNSKAGELKQHIKTLEMLFANFEIRHVTGEVDEDVYQREVNLLSTGLEAARRELDTVEEAVNQLSSDMPFQKTDIDVPQETEPETTEEIETPQSETEKLEETPQIIEIEKTPEETIESTLPEPPVESTESSDSDNFEDIQETEETWQDEQETWQDTEETQPMETIAEEE